MLCISKESWSVDTGFLFFRDTPTEYNYRLYKSIPNATLGKTVKKTEDFKEVHLADHTKAAPEEFL